MAIREPLKNVGGEARAKRICQKKRSLQVVNEHFFWQIQRRPSEQGNFSEVPKLKISAIKKGKAEALPFSESNCIFATSALTR